jgi:hypothetical protein
MPSKRAAKLRRAIPADELLAGKSYYSLGDIDQILQPRTLKADFDKAVFMHKLEELASYCVLSAHLERLPPSERERDLSTLATQIDRLRRRIAEADESQLSIADDLRYAARCIAKEEGALPEFGPEEVPLAGQPAADPRDPDFVTYWPVERQVSKCIRDLDWLHKVARRAETIAAQEKQDTGRNTEFLPLHVFVEEAMRIARESFDEDLKAYKNGIDATGSGIDYLESCLRPLGYNGGRGAILKLLEQ